jgi:hypothetical protein
MDSYMLDKRLLVRLLRAVALSETQTTDQFTALGIVPPAGASSDHLWEMLSKHLGKADAARVLFDLALNVCPDLERHILAVRHGDRVPIDPELPALVAEFFQPNGKPRRLGRLLVEHWQTKTRR